jgi:hypothetical protein
MRSAELGAPIVYSHFLDLARFSPGPTAGREPGRPRQSVAERAHLDELAPGHVAAEIRRVISDYEALKVCPLGADDGRLAVARVEFRIIPPGKNGLAQGHYALRQRFRRDRVTWPSGKDRIPHDNLTIKLQANAARGVTGHVDDPDQALPQLYLFAIEQGKIALQAKDPCVGWMDADGHARGVRQQNAARSGIPHCRQDGIGIRARVDNGY